VYGWDNRFDDPQRRYRTVSAASTKRAALAESLQDLRPDAKTRADFAAAFPNWQDDFVLAGRVPWGWRTQNVLCGVVIEPPDAQLIDLTSMSVRRELESEHVALLARYSLAHLDVSAVTSKQRDVTKAIGRTLFDREACGVIFPSAIAPDTCVALFEGRAVFVLGNAIPERLSVDTPDLLDVCAELGLQLSHGYVPDYVRQGKTGARSFSWLSGVRRHVAARSRQRPRR